MHRISLIMPITPTGKGRHMSSEVVKSIVARSLAKHSSNTFQPTDAHRKAKSAFWSHFFNKGEVAPETVEVATAARFSGYNEVTEWWAVPGFQEWFSNGEEFTQRVEYVSNLALDTLQAVLQDGAARTGDKLMAAKMALEIAAKFPKSAPKEHYADEKIAEMDRKQLEEFISTRIRSLKLSESESGTPKSVDTKPEDKVD